jgi:hypothetical protein
VDCQDYTGFYSLIITEALSLSKLLQAMTLLIFVQEKTSSYLGQHAGFPS